MDFCLLPKLSKAPLVAFIALGILSQPALSWEKKDAAEKITVKPALTVETTTPEVETWPILRQAQGGIWPWQDAVIAAETGGLRITKIYADIGTEVNAGQKLAQLSQQTVKVDVAQKQALVDQAKAELAEAQANAKRATEAKGTNAFSEQQTTQYLLARDKAKANLENAQAQLKSQQIRLQQTDVVAVDDGVISSRSAILGAVVQTGTELFRLVRKNRLEWRAELMADELQGVKPGQSVQINLNDNWEKGTVRVVAPTFDAKTRKATVYVDLPHSANIRAGMFASGNIILGQKEALTIPESALVLRDGYTYVFTVDNDKKVIQNKVSTGRRMANKVEIVSGLAKDAQIVSSGGAFLNNGDTVLVAETSSRWKNQK